MSEEDDAEYRRRLVTLLEVRGFGWVVQQAEAQIAEGKTITKQVSEREIFPASDAGDFIIRGPRSRRASLITSMPYSEEEGLEILLHAIEAALVQRSSLELATVESVVGIEVIRFEPEGPSDEADGSYRGKSHQIDSSRRLKAAEIEKEALAALAPFRSGDRART